MKGYIEKDALVADGWHLQRYISGDGYASVESMNIMDIPAADVVEVRHGRWLDALVIDLPVQMCDQCNTFFPLAYTGGGHHYCPNCGAKMDGGLNK